MKLGLDILNRLDFLRVVERLLMIRSLEVGDRQMRFITEPFFYPIILLT
ncbi:MAG TPA: hypothetical protein ACFCUY_05510 [Xenococcaceae cyanobacterium]